MIKGILFDKDGTLIDFYEVWGKAAVKVAKRLCDARRMPERQRMLLREMGVADGRVDPDGKRLMSLIIPSVSSAEPVWRTVPLMRSF